MKIQIYHLKLYLHLELIDAKIHIFQLAHFCLFKKYFQYFDAPKKALMIFLKKNIESVHKIAQAASILFSYVIYTEKLSFLLSSIFIDNEISFIVPYCPKYLLVFNVSILIYFLEFLEHGFYLFELFLIF